MSVKHDPDTAFLLVYTKLKSKGIDEHSSKKAAQRAYNDVMKGAEFKLKDYVR